MEIPKPPQNTTTPTTLEEAFLLLPPVVQNAIFESHWTDQIPSIAETAGLTDKQEAKLYVEVALMLYELTGPADLDQLLLQELNLSGQQAGELANTIREVILKPISAKIVQDINEIIGDIDDEYGDNTQSRDTLLYSGESDTEAEAEAEQVFEDVGIEVAPSETLLIKNAQPAQTRLEQALERVNIDQAIQNIGKTYNLHIDTMGMLHKRANEVLQGSLRATQFTQSVKSELGVDDEAARKIIRDVNQQIFKRVRDELRALTENPVEEVENALEESGITVLDEEEPKTSNPNAEFRADIVAKIEDPEKNHIMPKRTKDSDPYLEPID